MAERVAEDVVVVGDPGWAKMIAGMMRGARTINENRVSSPLRDVTEAARYRS